MRQSGFVDAAALERGRQVMLAALREAGINTETAVAMATGLRWEFGVDPSLCWRAANIAREAIGLDEWPWEEWCRWHRSLGPKTARWLDRWGAP